MNSVSGSRPCHLTRMGEALEWVEASAKARRTWCNKHRGSKR